ncbi:MAG: hypothetical protein EBS01_15095, partial [Verrucomicrobia bacterium]|nr:hypothetical protein [Verrucomicrobiota bacterium]
TDNGAGYGLTKAGAGRLVLSGSNSFTGVTTVNGGTLQIGAGSTSGSLVSSSVVVNGGSWLAFNRTDDYGGAFAPIISGAGSLLISAGTLSLGANQINGGNYAGNIINAAAFVLASASDQILSGVISGAGSLTQAGAGVLTLTGANTFSGPIFFNGGTIAISGTQNLGTSGSLFFNGGALSLSAGGTVSSRLVSLGTAGGVIAVASGGSLALTGNVTGSGALNKVDGGTLLLSGVNSYAGGTTLSGGTLVLGGNSPLGTGSLFLVSGSLDAVSAGASLVTNNNQQVWGSDITFLGTGSLNLGGGTVSLAGASRMVVVLANTLTVGGAIIDGGLNLGLTKGGFGALTLSGANSYTGGTTLSAGTLALGGTAALGSGSLFINGGSLNAVASGASLVANNNQQVWNSDFTFIGTGSLNLGGGTVTLGASRTVTVSANTLTVGGLITDGGLSYGLTKAGAGWLVL